MTGTQKRRKVYVDVNADHMRDGTARPNKITFEDGIYEVDRISARCRAASRKVAGMGIRYTVVVCGRETYLFDEGNGKWFVEAK